MSNNKLTSDNLKSSCDFSNFFAITQGAAWRALRKKLLEGSTDGEFQKVELEGNTLRCSNLIPVEQLKEIFAASLQEENLSELKDDPKRSVLRLNFGEQKFIIKRFHRLHKCLSFSPDCKAWLGAHRLDNKVECYAWFRNNLQKKAVIIFEDAGDHDLYMQKTLELPINELIELFKQAGRIIAILHQKNTYHADTKPGNFVFDAAAQNPILRLIDSDDVRCYNKLNEKRKIKNLAQFIGCSQKIISVEKYVTILGFFLREYLKVSKLPMSKLPKLFHDLATSTKTLYPEREKLNSKIIIQLQKLNSNFEAF